MDSATLNIVFEDRVAKRLVTDIKCHPGGTGTGTGMGDGKGVEGLGVFAILSSDGKVSLHELHSYRVIRIIR